MPNDPQLSARLARLFLDAGFLQPESYSALLVRIGAEGPSWQQFFEQDITAAALRLRGRGKGRNRVEAVERLAGPLALHLPEIVWLTTTFKPDPGELLDFLVECDAVTNQRADQIAARAATNDDLMRTLIDERLLSPRVLAEIVSSQLSYKAREIREQAASDILVYNELVEVDDIAHVVNKAHHMGTPASDHLAELLSQEDLVAAIVRDMAVPSAELKPEDLIENVEEKLPLEIIERWRFVPLELDADHGTLAVADALDFSIPDTLAILTGLSFSLVQVPAAQLDAVLKSILPEGSSQPALPQEISFADSGLFALQGNVSPGAAEEEFSAVDVVRRLLESAVAASATDIHLERVGDSMRVRFRVDGVLRNMLEIPASRAEAVVSRIKVLCNLDVTERRRPQDGHFTVEDRSQRFDFRVSTFPTVAGEKMVLRVLDAVTIVASMADLGLAPHHEAMYRRAIDQPYGLILVTGPTGAGKTSTLYAGLAQLNTVEKNIISIEDPVEYRLDGVSQMQVEQHLDLSFANGLRSSLRQDPDVIMVGEVRDPETASIALRASLTGHLVLSTIHANHAVGAISSLRYLGAKSYLVASSLLLVIAQRLVRRICEQCREVLDPLPSLRRDLGLDDAWQGHFFKGAGCQRCFYSGYRGRTGVFEFLELREALRAAIVSELDEATLASKASETGFEPLSVQARAKVLEGVTSPEEALAECFVTN